MGRTLRNERICRNLVTLKKPRVTRVSFADTESICLGGFTSIVFQPDLARKRAALKLRLGRRSGTETGVRRSWRGGSTRR